MDQSHLRTKFKLHHFTSTDDSTNNTFIMGMGLPYSGKTIMIKKLAHLSDFSTEYNRRPEPLSANQSMIIATHPKLASPYTQRSLALP